MLRAVAITGLVVLLVGMAYQAPPAASPYGKWQKDTPTGRYYCEYHYRPSDKDPVGVHYVVYDPHDPGWVYWLNTPDNPYNKKGEKSYWARCPTRANPTFGKQIREGKDLWSILPPEKRKSEFTSLRKDDFPEPKEMSPPVPNQDNPKRVIPCPPDPAPKDLPD